MQKVLVAACLLGGLGCSPITPDFSELERIAALPRAHVLWSRRAPGSETEILTLDTLAIDIDRAEAALWARREIGSTGDAFLSFEYEIFLSPDNARIVQETFEFAPRSDILDGSIQHWTARETPGVPEVTGRYSDEDLSADYGTVCGFAAADQMLLREGVVDILTDLGFTPAALTRLEVTFIATDASGRPFDVAGFAPDGAAVVSYERLITVAVALDGATLSPTLFTGLALTRDGFLTLSPTTGQPVACTQSAPALDPTAYVPLVTLGSEDVDGTLGFRISRDDGSTVPLAVMASNPATPARLGLGTKDDENTVLGILPEQRKP